MEIIKYGDSISIFLALIEVCVSERENRRFEEELNTKNKFNIY